jgi:hypothetical protein
MGKDIDVATGVSRTKFKTVIALACLSGSFAISQAFADGLPFIPQRKCVAVKIKSTQDSTSYIKVAFDAPAKDGTQDQYQSRAHFFRCVNDHTTQFKEVCDPLVNSEASYPFTMIETGMKADPSGFMNTAMAGLKSLGKVGVQGLNTVMQATQMQDFIVGGDHAAVMVGTANDWLNDKEKERQKVKDAQTTLEKILNCDATPQNTDINSVMLLLKGYLGGVAAAAGNWARVAPHTDDVEPLPDAANTVVNETPNQITTLIATIKDPADKLGIAGGTSQTAAQAAAAGSTTK